MATSLSDLTDDYMGTMRANAYAANTVRQAKRTLSAFLAHVGNVQVRHITPRHVDGYFAAREAAGIAPGTLNLELVHLRLMFKHAERRRLNTGDPTGHRRNYRVPKTGRRRVPAVQFPHLLDSCTHPRDRMVVALGLYLLLRQSEVAELRVADVDLHHGTVAVRVVKTDKFDSMPISAELDRELRVWLAWYTARCGPLQPTWFLVPAKHRPTLGKGRVADVDSSTVYPHRPVQTATRIVQRALVGAGYALRDDQGASMREGVHTLRRSAARAMFDSLADGGYDRAARIVQSLLHHSSLTQTEEYIGIESDRVSRDLLIRGKTMYAPADSNNVVQMRKVAGAES